MSLYAYQLKRLHPLNKRDERIVDPDVTPKS